jgi:hypothetical protein
MLPSNFEEIFDERVQRDVEDLVNVEGEYYGLRVLGA